MQDRKQTITEIFKDFACLKRAMLKEAPNLKLHVPPAQKEVLFTLAHNDGMHVKELAKSLAITSGAATQLTEALVQADLLIRETDADDRRIVHMYLSPSGRKLVQKLLKIRLALLEQVFNDLSDEEIEAFQNVIKKMNRSLEQDQDNNKDEIEDEWPKQTLSNQTNHIKVS
jgi:DNA-binding MarR family transcriptional regulator